MIARRLVVRGRVQGVGYRFAMTEAALVRGVAGWVRNRRDGTVEAVIQGDEASVARLIEWCRRGSPGAHVTAIETEAFAVDPALRSFTVRGTG